MSIIPFVEMATPRPPLGTFSRWICWEGLSTKPLVGWDIARGKIFVKRQSACVQHIQLKAKSLCENMQLDVQSKRIFNVSPPLLNSACGALWNACALLYRGQAYINSPHISLISLTCDGYLRAIINRTPQALCYNEAAEEKEPEGLNRVLKQAKRLELS